MAIASQKVETHWNYLLAIEGDLDRLSRYIEFDSRNFKCFSIEIARILLASGAEVDVVCKQICKQLNRKSKADKIHEYRSKIHAAYPNISGFEVLLSRFGLTLTPWKNWTRANKAPFWWTAYNSVKHHRHNRYERANLEHALNAVAGLFVVVLYLYKAKAESGDLVPAPQLLQASDQHIRDIKHLGYTFGMEHIL